MQQKFGSACLLFLDFAAAFPSLARSWIYLVLKAMQLPQNVIRAVLAMYSDNFHIYKSGSRIYFAMAGESGVKQGCPASATIFAWCSHPILMYLRSCLRPSTYIKAYADDIALALANIWFDLGLVFRALEVIANCAGAVAPAISGIETSFLTSAIPWTSPPFHITPNSLLSFSAN